MGYFSIREKQTIRFRCNSVERVTECRTPHTHNNVRSLEELGNDALGTERYVDLSNKGTNV